MSPSGSAGSVTGPGRLRTRWLLLCALLALTGYGSRLGHIALVQHVLCETHGVFEHAAHAGSGGSGGAPAAEDRRAKKGGSSTAAATERTARDPAVSSSTVDDHDECDPSAVALAVPAPVDVRSPDVLPLTLPADDGGKAAALSRRRLLMLAPKGSPPVERVAA